jgi:hypothetical protein
VVRLEEGKEDDEVDRKRKEKKELGQRAEKNE